MALDLDTRLALKANELAEALGVSERFIRTHQAEIPHFWVGRAVRFPVDQVRAWMSERSDFLRDSDGTLVDDMVRTLVGEEDRAE